MTVFDSTSEGTLAGARKIFALIVIVLVGAVMIGAVMTEEPLLGIGALIGVLFVMALFKWPDAATLLVVFYIYTNVGPVLMNYHDVPAYLAMGFPVLLSIPLVWYLLIKREKIIVTPVFLLLLLFLITFTLGAVFSSDIKLASPKLIDFILEGVLLYFFLTNVIRTPEMLKRVVWALLISGALIGGLSLYQQITNNFENEFWGFAQVQSDFRTGVETLQGEVEQARLSGSIGEKNRYAQNMLMLVPLGIFQFWIYRSSWARYLALLCTALIFAGGALAFSRGAAVGFVILIVTMALLRYIKFYQLLLLVLSAYIVMWMLPQYGTRLGTLSVFTDVNAEDGGAALNEADGAIRGRATDILAALLIFKDHPLVGVGPGMVTYYTPEYARGVGYRYITDNKEAHSLFPGLAAETGLFGLICFVGMLYISMRDLIRSRRRWLRSRPDWAALATAFFQVLVSYIATGLFLHLSYMRFFYMMLALAVVAGNFKETEEVVEPETAEAALVPSA